MEFLQDALELIRHLDESLLTMVQDYGSWIYAILFAIIFCETGLVVTPFLPGDSLLFSAGAVAATGAIDFLSLGVLLSFAAVAGDAVNYSLGATVVSRFLVGSRLVRRDHLARAEVFYRNHGGKAIFLARFAPFLRTFVPFVAGMARMDYRHFFVYNIAGGVAWVWLCCLGGYFFGNVPFVKSNFTAVILSIIVLSLVPVAVSAWRARSA
jgi:membrane-associated protein